jgi:hypothetical protein
MLKKILFYLVVSLFLSCGSDSKVDKNKDKLPENKPNETKVEEEGKDEPKKNVETEYYEVLVGQFLRSEIYFTSESGGNQIQQNNGNIEVSRPFSKAQDKNLKRYKIIKKNITSTDILFECEGGAEVKIMKEDDNLRFHISNVPSDEMILGMSVVIVKGKK